MKIQNPNGELTTGDLKQRNQQAASIQMLKIPIIVQN